MKNDKPVIRLDKINYYNDLELPHLIREASIAQEILSKSESVSEEKINDSKIIINELNKRLKKS